MGTTRKAVFGVQFRRADRTMLAEMLKKRLAKEGPGDSLGLWWLWLVKVFVK